MLKTQTASEAAVDRLMRDIAKDRARLAFAMQVAEDDEPRDDAKTGRLYRVFVAAGQIQ